MCLISKVCEVCLRRVSGLFQKLCAKQITVFDLTLTEKLFWVISFKVSIKNAHPPMRGMSKNYLHKGSC